MDLRRLRHGEWIAGVSGTALFVALFLDWYSADGGATANAWDSFTLTDIVLAVAALMGISLAVAAATQRSPAVPQTISALTTPVALAAALLAVIHALSLPDGASGRELGLYLGLAGAVGVLVGAWRSMGDQSFPAGVTPQVEVSPLPAPKPRSEPSTDE
jgi:uncharacterized membrane protein